jgi:hypothetical protein
MQEAERSQLVAPCAARVTGRTICRSTRLPLSHRDAMKTTTFRVSAAGTRERLCPDSR